MKKDQTVNLAEIARRENIKYPTLTKRIKDGISLEDAIELGRRDRDLRSVVGESLEQRTAVQSDKMFVFQGKTYTSVPDAAASIGVNANTVYSRRKQLMDKDDLSLKEATVKALEQMAGKKHTPRKRTPVTVFGRTYDSQQAAADHYGVKIVTINSRRDRVPKGQPRLSFEAALALVLNNQDNGKLKYQSQNTSASWQRLLPALREIFAPIIKETKSSITGSVSIRIPESENSLLCTITMTSAGFVSLHFPTINVKAESINELNNQYAGVKFVVVGEHVDMRCDIPVVGRIKTDASLVVNARNHCIAVLENVYRQQNISD